MNLSELIETHKGRRSYPELARDCGGAPSSKRLQQLVRDEMKNFPDPPTVRALARGLRVPQREVVLAAAESLGLDIGTSTARLMHLLPTTAADLSETQAAAIAYLVESIVSDPRLILDNDTDREHREPVEPTVLGVLAAQDEEVQRLRAVANGGDPNDATVVEALAKLERYEQTGRLN